MSEMPKNNPEAQREQAKERLQILEDSTKVRLEALRSFQDNPETKRIMAKLETISKLKEKLASNGLDQKKIEGILDNIKRLEGQSEDMIEQLLEKLGEKNPQMADSLRNIYAMLKNVVESIGGALGTDAVDALSKNLGENSIITKILRGASVSSQALAKDLPDVLKSLSITPDRVKKLDAETWNQVLTHIRTARKTRSEYSVRQHLTAVLREAGKDNGDIDPKKLLEISERVVMAASPAGTPAPAPELTDAQKADKLKQQIVSQGVSAESFNLNIGALEQISWNDAGKKIVTLPAAIKPERVNQIVGILKLDRIDDRLTSIKLGSTDMPKVQPMMLFKDGTLSLNTHPETLARLSTTWNSAIRTFILEAENGDKRIWNGAAWIPQTTMSARQ